MNSEKPTNYNSGNKMDEKDLSLSTAYFVQDKA
jgi:hypothetical protein